MDLLQNYCDSDEDACEEPPFEPAVVISNNRNSNTTMVVDEIVQSSASLSSSSKRKQDEGVQAHDPPFVHPKIAKKSPRNVLVPPQVSTKRANAVTEDLSAVKGGTGTSVITKRK